MCHQPQRDAILYRTRRHFKGCLKWKSNHHEEFMKLVLEIIELFGGLSLVDLFPSIKLLHLIHAIMRPKSKNLHQKADRFLKNIIMECRAK
ncbi:hypothetical protein SLA2020_238170 [Shorea laevis]